MSLIPINQTKPMIPKAELADINRHDHCPAAEDSPSKDNLHDVELSSRIVGNTLIKFIATYRGHAGWPEEYVYETYRKEHRLDGRTVWIDKQLCESLRAAILDAVSYMPRETALTESDVLRTDSQMTHEASHNARGGKS